MLLVIRHLYTAKGGDAHLTKLTRLNPHQDVHEATHGSN